jgi:hypothetical protein
MQKHFFLPGKLAALYSKVKLLVFSAKTALEQSFNILVLDKNLAAVYPFRSWSLIDPLTPHAFPANIQGRASQTSADAAAI